MPGCFSSKRVAVGQENGYTPTAENWSLDKVEKPGFSRSTMPHGVSEMPANAHVLGAKALKNLVSGRPSGFVQSPVKSELP
jgi:hypothetical protein